MEPLTLDKKLQSNLSKKNSLNDFASFFRGYSIGLALIVASLPILVTSFDVLPVFATVKKSISLITSLISYLWVGYLWLQRSSFTKIFFPFTKLEGRIIGNIDKMKASIEFSRWIPGLLILLTIICFIAYNYSVHTSVESIAYKYAKSTSIDSSFYKTINIEHASSLRREYMYIDKLGVNKEIVVEFSPVMSKDDKTITGEEQKIIFNDEETINQILLKTPSIGIPGIYWNYLLFMLFFILPTTAFIIMGLKDYFQEKIGITDQDVWKAQSTDMKYFKIENYNGIEGRFEYCPGIPQYGFTNIQVYSHEMDTPLNYRMGEDGKMNFYYSYTNKDGATVRVNFPVETNRDQDSIVDFQERLENTAKEKFMEITKQGNSSNQNHEQLERIMS